MQPIDNYLSLVMRMTSVSFRKEVDGFFLLKRPKSTPSQTSIPVQISFDTVLDTLNFEPFATEWLIAAVKKRQGNPYADRVSIGRATNCDIVLRAHFISKVQAHILCGPNGEYSLRVLSSASATLLNGRRIDPNLPCRLAVGDLIAFGSMTFEFVDAGRLHEVLTTEALHRNSEKSQRPPSA